ncbi:hypothetical protein BX600DRAFT_512215 [Xylariales sp. PMI_506]|nr:hypothetical protein BX600DRAFT_512215 [Xylariales sp. PMI_506]
MNTIRSFWLGWGALCVAGGGAYYVAKKQINADRAAKQEELRVKRRMIESLESQHNVHSQLGGSLATGNGTSPRTDPSGSPSQEASNDPAPTRHAPATEGQRVVEKSKYESTQPFTSRKGDRFS